MVRLYSIIPLFTLVLASAIFSVKAELIANQNSDDIWDEVINPIHLPLGVVPVSHYRLNATFPGIYNDQKLSEFGIGINGARLSGLSAHYQKSGSKIQFGSKIHGIDIKESSKDYEYDFNSDSTLYETRVSESKNYSVSLSSWLSSKKSYTTGFSIEAGISYDSAIDKQALLSFPGNQELRSQTEYARLLKYYLSGVFIQGVKSKKRRTFLLLRGSLNNQISNYKRVEKPDDIDRFIYVFEYQYQIKPGVITYFNKNVVAGIFAMLNLEKITVENDEQLFLDDANDVYNDYESDLRESVGRFTAEGFISYRKAVKNLSVLLGGDLGISYKERFDNLGVVAEKDWFFEVDWLVPIMFQINIKDILTISSSYNLGFSFDYLFKRELDGLRASVVGSEYSYNLDFSTTPLAFTLNLKDRFQTSFVPSFNSKGVFVYKMEMRFFLKAKKTSK